MQQLPLACFLSLIRPPGISFEDSYLQILPLDKAKCPFVKDQGDVTFRLYTRHNPLIFQELKIGDDESMFASHMNFHDPTVIYFSAFLEQPDDGSGLQVRESYMLRGDTNFIILDLSRLEAGPWYFTAAENTWYIGNYAAKFIDYLVSRGLDLKKTHLVGHSLGAQSAGVAGSALKSGRVSRITGLDPAFPLFDKLPLIQRLDPTDADFVDVIHTDAGIFGFNRPTGHVDFYPNGGISPQPGCELEIVLHDPRLFNKFTGDHTNSTVNQSFDLRLSLPLHVTPGVTTRAVTVQEGIAHIWDTGQIRRDGNAQLHGYFIFTLEMKKDTKFEQNILQFFTLINVLKKKVNENTENINLTTDLETYDINKHNKNHKQVNNKEEHFLDTTNLRDEEVKTVLYNINHKRDKRISFISDNDIKDTNNTLRKSTKHIANTDAHKETNNKTNKGKNRNKNKEVKIKVFDTNNKRDKYPSFIGDNKINASIYLINTTKTNTDKDANRKDETQTDDTPKKAVQQNTDTDVKETQTPRRHKRFISFFRNDNDDNFLFKILEFLIRNRRNILPVVTVMREINTLVKNGNGELSHFTKERNNYIGANPPLIPITYDLQIGDESKLTAFVKRLLGLASKGGKLTVNGSGK